MLLVAEQAFKDFLFEYFIEWEKQQPKRRSTFTAFARWLSENSLQVTIKQQMVDDWMKGRYKPKDENNSLNSYKTFFVNKLYIGILEFGDLTVADYCQPMLDIALWKRVQKKISARAQTQLSLNKNPALESGIFGYGPHST